MYALAQIDFFNKLKRVLQLFFAYFISFLLLRLKKTGFAHSISSEVNLVVVRPFGVLLQI